MLPTPSHLIDCTIPTPDRADDHQYAGHVQCKCGSDSFELYHTGGTHEWDGETIPCVTAIGDEFYLRVVARCTGCGIDLLILDMDFHGWNGFVCREESKTKRPRPPLTRWPCRACGALVYNADVVVSGEDKETAIGESDGLLDESNWHEGFRWIDIHLHCTACGDDHKSWVSYETM